MTRRDQQRVRIWRAVLHAIGFAVTSVRIVEGEDGRGASLEVTARSVLRGSLRMRDEWDYQNEAWVWYAEGVDAAGEQWSTDGPYDGCRSSPSGIATVIDARFP